MGILRLFDRCGSGCRPEILKVERLLYFNGCQKGHPCRQEMAAQQATTGIPPGIAEDARPATNASGDRLIEATWLKYRG